MIYDWKNLVMVKNFKNIAIIPARGGSKRIPRKNIKLLFGKPIIGHVIEILKATKLFDEIIVSTDDKEIKEISEKYGAKVPFFRSRENSDDNATLVAVIIEVMDQYRSIEMEFDNICCVLPTSALILPAILGKALNDLEKNNFDSIIPIVKYSAPIQRALEVDNGIVKMKDTKYINVRTQDLSSNYFDSGQFYWAKSSSIRLEKKLFMQNSGVIILNELQAQDVDDPMDWEMLELKYEFHQKS